mmetsp:Transcript_19207/g.16449  ORF Transcript_19207/g.16449 Transcript_19207/m.16449 type:complete len:85 (+) Transcript_19207:1-255(+)
MESTLHHDVSLPSDIDVEGASLHIAFQYAWLSNVTPSSPSCLGEDDVYTNNVLWQSSGEQSNEKVGGFKEMVYGDEEARHLHLA